MENIIVALIAAAGGLLGSLIGLISNNRLIVYRIDWIKK